MVKVLNEIGTHVDAVEVLHVDLAVYDFKIVF
jgi:hypothetical protein